ncbi:MAG TPA: hypothetical protein VG367_05135 [Mucilaginibacter sp.]|nr:hypothetical protein [Mucilaginibacter sp.]
MRNKVYSVILTFITTILVSCSYAQVIDFQDARTYAKFKLRISVLTVGDVIIKEKIVYNALSGDDTPNKYHSELIFGKYAFQAKIFDNTNKPFYSISKSFFRGEKPDSFLKSYDSKTNTEYYTSSKQGFSISFQRIGQYPDNWIKIHVIASMGVESGRATNSYIAFYGTGDFLYNTTTHEIKQN